MTGDAQPVTGATSKVGAPDEEAQTQPAEQPVSLLELFRTADVLDRALLVVGSVCGALCGSVQPIFTIIFASLVDTLGTGEKMSVVLRPVVLWFCYLGTGALFTGGLEVACFELTGMRQSNRIRRQYLTSLMRQEAAFHDAQDSGALLARMVADATAIQTGIAKKLPGFIQHGCAAVLGVLIGLVRGWQMGLVVCSTLPLLGASGAGLALIGSRHAAETQAAYAAASALTKETFSQMRVVAAYGGEARSLARYVSALAAPHAAALRQARWGGLALGSIFLTIFGTYALALWYGTTLLLAGHYTGGRIMNVLFATILGGFELGQALPNIKAISAARVAAASAFAVIDRVPVIDDSASPDHTHPSSPAGEIELRDVRFSYPTRPGVVVMAAMQLRVPAGSSMALVGASGSGKSTVIQLLLRFYDPQAGTVLVDGVDLRSLDLAWYRRHCGLVSQEPALFSGSVADNIGYGKEGASREEVEAAALAANAAEFIDKLPLGLDTPCGERGVQLSGGQKQRVAIARALLRNPRILLLDEATSALDSESERVVQAALDKLIAAGGRTSIVVAHRLSTVRDCDCIAVMAAGAVVQLGAHSALAQDADGPYAALLRAQDAEEPDAEPPPQFAISASKAADAPSIAPGAAGDEAQAEAEGPSIRFSRVLALAGAEASLLPLGVVASAINGAVMPSFALSLGSIIAAFYLPHDALAAQVRQWCLIFVGVAVAAFIVNVLQSWAMDRLGAAAALGARRACYAAALRMHAAWFDEPANASGLLASRLEADAANVRGGAADAIAVAVQNAVVLGGGLAIAFVYSWQLTLVILAALPLLLAGSVAQMQMDFGEGADNSGLYAASDQLLADALGNARAVAAYGLSGRMVAVYSVAQEGPSAALRRRAAASGGAYGFAQGMAVFLYALAYWFGGWLVDRGSASPGNVFKCYFAVEFLGLGIAQAAVTFPAMGKAAGAVKSVFAIMDRESQIDADAGGLAPDEVAGALELRDVQFAYPCRPAAPVLSGMQLRVPAGSSMALVGASGSGKSTVIQLLLRFYDPQAGSVLVDGVDLRSLDLAWYRRHCGLVSQEPALFSGSIADNIGYGKEGASREEVEAAALAANAAEFIDKLPLGLDTPCGERGVQLSGGQKQRVAIARALLRNPRILLLDEATSALDSESERVVQAALDKLIAAGGRTSIVVAHRLSTVRDCDCIAVMAAGAVVQLGAHSALAQDADGRYSRMLRAAQRSS